MVPAVLDERLEAVEVAVFEDGSKQLVDGVLEVLPAPFKGSIPEVGEYRFPECSRAGVPFCISFLHRGVRVFSLSLRTRCHIYGAAKSVPR
jgi:hypothetical protein